MNLQRIASACARECVRQKVGLRELEGLIKAYRMAIEYNANYGAPTENTIIWTAGDIDPYNKIHGYRTIPVTFANGDGACVHDAIPRAMERLFDCIKDYRGGDLEGPTLDEIVKAFLDIHPFKDGNGRTAFILYNWLLGTFNNPLPLPNYYKEVGSLKENEY